MMYSKKEIRISLGVLASDCEDVRVNHGNIWMGTMGMPPKEIVSMTLANDEKGAVRTSALGIAP